MKLKQFVESTEARMFAVRFLGVAIYWWILAAVLAVGAVCGWLLLDAIRYENKAEILEARPVFTP